MLNQPKSKAEFDKAMKEMLIRVQNGDDLSNLDAWETEVTVTCSDKGFLSQPKYALRTQDGKMHTEYDFPHVEQLGIEFLHSQRWTNRINWSLIISLCALLISFLTNIDKITGTLQELIARMQSMQ